MWVSSNGQLQGHSPRSFISSQWLDDRAMRHTPRSTHVLNLSPGAMAMSSRLDMKVKTKNPVDRTLQVYRWDFHPASLPAEIANFTAAKE